MYADAGVFVEKSFDSRLADAAEAGKLRYGGLPVDVAVQIVDGFSKQHDIRCGGNGGNRAAFGKGQHQLVQPGGQHLGINRCGVKWLQPGPRPDRQGCSGPFPEEGKHVRYDLLLGGGQIKNLFRQKGGQRAFRAEGKNQQLRSASAVYKKLVELKRFVEDERALCEVVNPFVAGNAYRAVHDIDAFPEIVRFPGKFIAAVIMRFKQGKKRRDFNLFSDLISCPYHKCLLPACCGRFFAGEDRASAGWATALPSPVKSS